MKYVKCWAVWIKILRVLILFADAFFVNNIELYKRSLLTSHVYCAQNIVEIDFLLIRSLYMFTRYLSFLYTQVEIYSDKEIRRLGLDHRQLLTEYMEYRNAVTLMNTVACMTVIMNRSPGHWGIIPVIPIIYVLMANIFRDSITIYYLQIVIHLPVDW